MINIFNRKELFITFSINEQARIRKILADNKIDYSIKVIDRMNTSSIPGGTRSSVGTLGQNSNNMCEYIIYVRKIDFEKAEILMKEQQTD